MLLYLHESEWRNLPSATSILKRNGLRHLTMVQRPVDATKSSSSADIDVAGDLYSGTAIDDGSGVTEGTKSAAVGVAGDLDSGTFIDNGSGTIEGTESSFPTVVDVALNLHSGTLIDAGSGGAEGIKPSSSDGDDGGDLKSGTVIDDGSGTAEGAESSASGFKVSGNLCNGTTIEDGSGVEEGTNSLFATDVKVAGDLENERFDVVGRRSAGLYSSCPGTLLSSLPWSSAVRVSAGMSSSTSYPRSSLPLGSDPLFITSERISIAESRLFMNR